MRVCAHFETKMVQAYCKCSKILNAIYSCLPKKPRQTGQISDQTASQEAIKVFHVCYSDKHFVNSSPDN